MATLEQLQHEGRCPYASDDTAACGCSKLWRRMRDAAERAGEPTPAEIAVGSVGADLRQFAARENLTQPPPKPGKQDVTAFLLDAIAKRREMGLKKYGTSLQTWNGRDPLADAMEEDLDRMQYLVQARLERADMAERIAELAAALDKKQGLYLLARMIVHRIRDDGTLDSVEKIRALCASAMESLPVDEVDR